MFDKVKTGGTVGGAAALLLAFAQSLFPDLQVPEGSGPEETIGRIVLHLVPVLIGLFAAWRKKERTGYGSRVVVDTTGSAPAAPLGSGSTSSRPAAPSDPTAYEARGQEPTRRDRFGDQT